MDVYEFRTNKYDDCRAFDGNENGRDSNKCEQNQGHSSTIVQWMNDELESNQPTGTTQTQPSVLFQELAFPILSNPNNIHVSDVSSP